MGITTLPLVFRTKQPAVGWKELPYREATTEEQREIEQRFTDGQPYGLASVCGLTRNGLYHLVLDIDNEDEARNFLSAYTELEKTLRVKTPRGVHLHLLSRKPVRNYGRESRLPFGLEVLGRHLAVIPPSVNEQGQGYKVINPEKGVLIMDNFEDTLRRWFPEWTEAQEPANIPPKAKHEEDYWVKLLQGVPEGERDNACIRLAGHYKATGVNREEAKQILYGYADRCSPPFPLTEVDKCVRSAYSYPDEPILHAETSTGIEVRLLDEVLEEVSEVDYIWNEVIFAGSSNILVAKPKVGKSTLALNLALTIANAREDTEFLSRKVCSRHRVIYMSLDENARVIKQRLGSRKAGGNFYITESCPGIGALLKLLEGNPGSFLVIDTLQKLFGSKIKDLNDYAQVVNALAPLQSKARETNCTILLIHHGKKLEVEEVGDNTLGSTALFGGCDTLLELKVKDKKRVISSVQRIGSGLEEVVVKLGENGEIRSGGSLQEAEIQTTQEQIIQTLAGEQELSAEEIANKISEQFGESRVKASVWKALKGLEAKGLIRHTGEGKRNNPKRYSLCDSV
jgi:hypothetical protein